MEPIKSLFLLSKWFLRVSLAIILYRFYFQTFETLDFNSLEYFISLIMIIAAVAIIAGGALKKNTLTVVTGLVIVIISIVNMFVADFDLQRLITNFVPASLGFFFIASGNKS